MTEEKSIPATAQIQVFGKSLTLHGMEDWGFRGEVERMAKTPPYPILAFLQDVRTILDAGAAFGLASVWFAARYPEAVVHAVEPVSASFAVLEKNAAQLPNITCHRLGLSDKNGRAMINIGDKTLHVSSLRSSPYGNGQSEEVRLMAALDFAKSINLKRFDIIKVDTEGAEPEIIRSLLPILPATQAVYVEYHSEPDRRALEAMLTPGFTLFASSARRAHLGECCYVNTRLLEQTRYHHHRFFR